MNDEGCCRRQRALIVGHIGFDYYINKEDLAYCPETFARLVTKEDFQNYVNNHELKPYLGGTAGNVVAIMRSIGSLEVDRFTCGDFEGIKKYDDMTPAICQPSGEINKSFDTEDPNLCVPICLILDSGDEEQDFLLYDPTLNVYNAIQQFNLTKDNVREYELLHITTVPPNATLKIVEEVHEESPDIIISFCPGQNLKLYTPETLFKVLDYVNILFVNDTEMKMLSEWALDYVPDLKSFPDIIINTRGSRSTVINADDIFAHIPVVAPKKVVDTTGAGDAYAGAFLSSYMIYKDPVRAAKFAATVASFIVEEVGCQTNIPDSNQIYERCRVWKE